MCMSKTRQIACAMLFVVIAIPNGAAQTAPIQSAPVQTTQSQSLYMVIRRDVGILPSRSAYVKDSLTRLFKNYVRVDTANASKLELQLNSAREIGRASCRERVW